MNMKSAKLMVENALAQFLPDKMNSPEAVCELLVIGCQESRFRWTEQIGGPARGYWMFELNGVIGVMEHPWSREYVKRLCEIFNVAFDARAIHGQLAGNFNFACCLARLLLYTDSNALPQIGQAITAWLYYIRNWRPGKPRQESWCSCYLRAVRAVDGQ